MLVNLYREKVKNLVRNLPTVLFMIVLEKIIPLTLLEEEI